MTRRLFWLTLRTRRTAILAFSAVMGLCALAVIGLWPTTKALNFAAYLEGLPPAVRALFLGDAFGNVEVERSAFFQYLGVEYATWAPMVMAYFGVWFGAGIVTRDFDRRTLLVLLALPVGRLRYLSARGAAVVVAAALVAAFTIVAFGVALSIWGGGEPRTLGDVALLHVQLWLFTLASGGLGALCGALLLEPGRAYGVAAALLAAMFLLSLVTRVIAGVEGLGYVSFFTYWRPAAQLVLGAFLWRDALVLIGVALVLFAAALAVFRRRDIAA
ncbi:MAG: ABC transporter permease subunit [Actinobacteria bacterium]|nr:ABC transporter permease subunit [Actinomycetota bacterium]